MYDTYTGPLLEVFWGTEIFVDVHESKLILINI